MDIITVFSIATVCFVVAVIMVGSNGVTFVGNCSSGQVDWVPDDATRVEGVLYGQTVTSAVLSSEFDTRFHLAASKAVDANRSCEQFESNTQITYNVLESMREHDVGELVYTSSSPVYSEAPQATMSVNRITDIVSKELGYDPKYGYTGGKRGWNGDVPKIPLLLKKLSALGRGPEIKSDEAVRKATRELIYKLC